ncbi:PREDICTED: uncharacterized protein LOC104698940 [Camelina sativa]|uniref:Uncharacterized protein LOC104698940 n=1 Tax=Camelina sativa TaxID=90675 RepID=A0ABM0SKS9_CAMSA|nr:PREDICTED: uncharacterized protein LOC104698940 [Camelina sativa]
MCTRVRKGTYVISWRGEKKPLVGNKRIEREGVKAKINSVLEKKLEELESLLEVVNFTDDDDPNLRKIQLGILFVRTLLAAEISSRRLHVEGEEDVDERFDCLAKRLTEIEASIINQWPGHHDNGSLIKSEMESLETNDGIINGETGADYSSVGSCLNESSKAEEEEEEEVEAEQWPMFQDAPSEEMEEVKFPVAGTVKEEVMDREVKGNGRVCFRALVYFGLIGLVGGMISLVGYIGDSNDNLLLTPT